MLALSRKTNQKVIITANWQQLIELVMDMEDDDATPEQILTAVKELVGDRSEIMILGIKHEGPTARLGLKFAKFFNLHREEVQRQIDKEGDKEGDKESGDNA